MKHTILIVDDEAANLRMLERLFSDQYNVLTAASGPEGLEQLVRHEVALIMADQRMPGMTGIEFLKRASEMRRNTVRIILTGYTDVDALVEAINSGVVYKYITKPWSNTDLQQTILRAVEHYDTLLTRSHLEQENARHHGRMKATMRGFINLAMEMLSLKGSKIGAHTRRTAKYAAAIGGRLKMEPDELDKLYMTALLHEVANIRIPAHFMSRATPLSTVEMALMQDNFKRGCKLLADIPEFEEIAAAISFQHDHYDGFGSPHRLSGDQIPLASRILAIADAYDEMREPSGPLPGFSHSDAVSVLQSAAGRRYDPQLVDIFCSLPIEKEGVADTVGTLALA